MNLQTEIGTWAQETFGEHQRDIGVVNHLIKETIELDLAVRSGGNVAEECADCLMLLFDIAHRNGFDLIMETAKKLKINKGRTWGEIDEDGVIEHE